MSRAKIAAIRASIRALEAKITPELLAAAEAEVDTDSIVAGDTVSANYGRKDNVRLITGVVKGVKREPGKAALFKVSVGEGFDSEDLIVFASAIVSVVPAVQPEAPVDPLAGAVADGVETGVGEAFVG